MNRFFAKYLVYGLGQAIRMEPVIPALRSLERSQHSSRSELEALQRTRLREVLKHAESNIPFYQAFFGQTGLSAETITLDQLPTVSKLDIRDRSVDYSSIRMPLLITRKTSGGSTGQTTTVLKDRKSTAIQRASMYRGYRWAGIDIGDKQVRFWGVPLDSGTKFRYRLIDFFMNRIRLSAFRFSDEDLRRYYQDIRSFKPKYFYGYASMLYEFSQFVYNNDLNGKVLGLRAIISTSEVLYPTQRAHLSKVFDCPVYNEYGCGELGPVAFECSAGKQHINAENIIVEVLRDGHPVKAGETGELVLTELNNLAMPLIRYRMGDVGSVADELCDCGRTLPVLSHITGRALDFVTTADGRRIHGEYFNYLMEELQKQGRAVRQFQVVQHRIGAIDFCIVKDESFSEATLDFLNRELKNILGTGTQIVYQYKDEIERLDSGKLRLVVSHLGDTA